MEDIWKIESFSITKDGRCAFRDEDLFLGLSEEEGRLAGLFDGLGSSIKTNILATIAAPMALKFIRSDSDTVRSVEVMMNLFDDEFV